MDIEEINPKIESFPPLADLVLDNIYIYIYIYNIYIYIYMLWFHGYRNGHNNIFTSWTRLRFT